MNKIRKWTSCVLCVLLVCLLLAGCGNGAEPNGTQGEDGTTNGSDTQNETPKKLEIETRSVR